MYTVLVPTHGPAVEGDHELVPLVALAAATARVLDDDRVALRLATAGHRLVVDLYDTAEVERRAADVIEQVLGSPRCVVVRRAPHLAVAPAAVGMVVSDAAGGVLDRLDPATAAVFLMAGTGTDLETIVHRVAATSGGSPSDTRATVEAVIHRLCARGLLVRIQAR